MLTPASTVWNWVWRVITSPGRVYKRHTKLEEHMIRIEEKLDRMLDSVGVFLARPRLAWVQEPCGDVDDFAPMRI